MRNKEERQEKAMWISQQMIAAQKAQPQAQLGSVTGNVQAGIVAQGAGEYRNLQAVTPYGLAYLPPDGAQAVILASDAGNVCIGTLAEDKGIQAGEVLLYSTGGASVYLKNTGEVVINGQVFAKKGA